MGYSQAQKAQSRQRVLETASRQIRERGFEALGVAECMRSAGLTHGAFYGHFSSRDALIVEALDYAIAESGKRFEAPGGLAGDQNKGEISLSTLAERFLSERHVKDPGNGCALCALAGEGRHAGPEVRERLTRYVDALALRIAQSLATDQKGRALGIVATLVGAVTLARVVESDREAKAILDSSLALILAKPQDVLK